MPLSSWTPSSFFSSDTRNLLVGLFQQAPAAIAIFSSDDLVYELANPHYLELMNRTSEQLLHRPVLEAFPNLDPEIHQMLLSVFREGKTVEAKEFPILLDWDGKAHTTARYINMVLTPYRNSSGNISGVFASAVDVSAQVIERHRAIESEEQLRTITDRLPALISYMSTDRRYKFVNEAYSKWFGIPREDILGKTRQDLVNDSPTQSKLGPLEDQAFSGKEVSFELTLTKGSGEYVNLDVEFLPDRKSDGTVQGMVGVGHDVTSRKALLQQTDLEKQRAEELAEKLKEALSSRDEFMSIASHELKTPITSLKLQLQLSKRQLKVSQETNPAASKLISVIEGSLKQVDRLTDLIESLLDVARIRAGRIEYKLSDFNLKEMIAEVCERLSEQLDISRSPLSVVDAPDVPVHWDRFRMEQVLMNMITNSIKYAPGKNIVIEYGATDSLAHFSVHDAGPGIPKERHDKIFERFERATASRNISGLGLGLFIANQIVKGHHGTITVESSPETGTKFVVVMPR